MALPVHYRVVVGVTSSVFSVRVRPLSTGVTKVDFMQSPNIFQVWRNLFSRDRASYFFIARTRLADCTRYRLR